MKEANPAKRNEGKRPAAGTNANEPKTRSISPMKQEQKVHSEEKTQGSRAATTATAQHHQNPKKETQAPSKTHEHDSMHARTNTKTTKESVAHDVTKHEAKSRGRSPPATSDPATKTRAKSPLGNESQHQGKSIGVALQRGRSLSEVAKGGSKRSPSPEVHVCMRVLLVVVPRLVI